MTCACSKMLHSERVDSPALSAFGFGTSWQWQYSAIFYIHIYGFFFSACFECRRSALLLSGVTWQQYDSLLATLGDYPGLRLIYLEGTLEIFMSSAEYELIKKVLARLIERYAEAVDLSQIFLFTATVPPPFVRKPRPAG